MLQLNALECKNYIVYPSAKLKLESGVTVIRGLNLDSKSHDGLNRVGKSVIPSIIPRLRYGAPPQPMDASKRKTGAIGKNTVLNLDLQRERDHYRIQGYFDRTVRTRILEGKANRGIRLKKDAEAALEQLFPHNEDQFYSTVYLDGRRPATLQYGRDAQRFAFFEQVFDLGIYKRLSDKLKPLLQEQAQLAAERKVLQEQSEDLGAIVDVRALESQRDAALVAVQKHRKGIDGWRAEIQTLTLFLSAMARVSTQTLPPLKTVQTKIVDLQTQIEAVIQAREQQRIFEDTEKQRKTLDTALARLADVVIDQTLPNEIIALNATARELENDWKLYTKALKDVDRETAALAALEASLSPNLKSMTPERLLDIQRQTDATISFIDRLTDVLDGSLDDHERACPVCTAKFKPRAFIERVEKEHETAQKKKRAIQKAFAWHEKKDQLAALQSLIQKPELEPAAIRQEVAEKEAALEDMRRKASLLRQKKSLPTVAPVTVSGDLETLRTTLRRYQVQSDTIQKNEEARATLQSLNVTLSKSDAEKRLASLERALPKKESELADLEETVTLARTVLGDATRNNVQIKVLKGQIESLDKQLAQHTMLSGLRMAFGPKGLVKLRTQDIAKSFEIALNEYSSFLFDEPISFRLEVTETKFGIYATRNGLEDDVRSLSGQESRAFSLITLLVLLRFLPAHLRCDFVILDEMEANMDAPSRKLFADKLMPELLRFVNKVILITPLSRAEFYVPDAEEFYAVKHKGKAQLVPFANVQAMRDKAQSEFAS